MMVLLLALLSLSNDGGRVVVVVEMDGGNVYCELFEE